MAGTFDHNIISRVQQANDIVDIIGEHLSLAKKGKEMVGLCPFHDDHAPSFYVNPAKQIYKCFACGAGGDVFKFIQMKENLSFPQAVEMLAERAGIEIKPSQQKHQRTQDGNEADPKLLLKVNVWAKTYWQGG